MNLSEQIQLWFQNEGSYFEGINLYRATGGDTRIYESYLSGSYVPADVEARLQEALIQYTTANPASFTDSPNPPQVVVPPTPLVITIDPGNTTEPPIITQLRASAKPLHKQQDAIKAELRFEEDPDKRYQLANQLMSDVTPSLDQIYDQIEEFKKTGKLPVIATEPTGFQEGVRVMKRINTIAPRISKIKGLLKKNPDAARRQALEKELLEKEVELKELNELIN